MFFPTESGGGGGHGDNSYGAPTRDASLYTSDSVDGGSGSPRTTLTVRWDCHAHHTGDCSMAYVNGLQYHVVPVKEVSLYTQTRYNKIADVSVVGNNEFWEVMPNTNTAYMTPVASCDLINDYEFVRKIFLKFAELDAESVVYTRYGSASDMVRRHVLTDCVGNVALCNKHLIRPVARKEGRIKYTSVAWARQTIKALFPKAMSTTKNNIPTGTQAWVLEILKSPIRTGQL